MDVFHDQECTVARMAGVINCDDVWVLEAGGQACFSFDLPVDITCRAIAEQLDSHPTAKAAVLGEPNFAHAPAADEALNPVAAFKNAAFHACCSLSEQWPEDEQAHRGTFSA